MRRLNDKNYEKRGTMILASVFGVFVFLLWVLVQRMDFRDCVAYGIGC